jgi:hypothetical protein
MDLDFTYRAYRDLLIAAKDNGYEILTVEEYLTRDDLPEQLLILRHDVDRKVENALDMAELEASLGVSSSYYFRAIDKTFDPEIFERVSELGHEVGYHYEDVDEANGDLDAARRRFERNLEQFREHVPVDTVSMHGNPLTPYDNRDVVESIDLDAYGLSGEVYLSFDFSEVVYFSDTNRTWYEEKTIVNDWPVGPSEKPTQVETTGELIDLLEEQSIPKLYLLVHPNRWADSTAEWAVEYSKDVATNGGKWGLWFVRSLRGDDQSGDTVA